ncbi:MAG TPA: hypothetical protein GXX36_09645 [Clostridiaceae bacterium]|nr:hypothetical protein [Clostridiaceae bacterium]
MNNLSMVMFWETAARCNMTAVASLRRIMRLLRVITRTTGYPLTIGLNLTTDTHDSKTLDIDGYTWDGNTLTLKNVIINVPK